MEENEPQVKVDVELQWKDFKWSLELLRHNEDFTRGSEKDWFQINPTEIVLLACEAIGKADKAVKALPSRVVIGFDDLSSQLRQRPRLFRRLVGVILRTLCNVQDDAATPIVNRFLSALLYLVTGARNQLQMYHGHMWHRLTAVREQLSSVMLKHNPDGSSTVREYEKLFRGMDADLAKREWTEPDNLGQSELYHAACGMLTELGLAAAVQDSILWQLYSSCEHLSRVLGTDLATSVDLLSNVGLCQFFTAMPQLLQGLDDGQSEDIISSMIEIAEFLVTQHSALAEASSQPSARLRAAILSTSQSTAAQDGSESEEPAEQDNDQDGGARNHSVQASPADSSDDLDVALPTQGNVNQPPILSPLQRCAELLNRLVGAMTKVVHTHFQEREGRYRMLRSLPELCFVILASQEFSSGFEETKRFLEQQLNILVVYATEGYLTQHPLSFLDKLLDFLMTSLENDQTMEVVLNSSLPNAFGYVFGIRHSDVSLLVIEFVTLSLYSRHQKDLQKSGLESILSAFRLIKTETQKRSEELQEVKRVEAVRVAHMIVDEVLERVDQHCAASQHQAAEEALSAGEDPPQAAQRVLRWQPSVLEAPTEISCDGLVDEHAKRVNVLVGMLRLACAMVARGENIVFLFRSVVPKLIQEVPPTTNATRQQKLARFFGDEVPENTSTIAWQGDRKDFLITLFALAADFKNNSDLSVFHMCAIIVPSFAAGLSRVSALDDAQKLELTTSLLEMIRNAFLKCPQHISDFVSHGFDLITSLAQPDASAKDVLGLAKKIVQMFVGSSRTSVAMLARQCVRFFVNKFPAEDEAIRRTVCRLFESNSLLHLRCLHRLCREELQDEWYCDARQLLYQLACRRPPALRDFLFIGEFLALLMDLCPARPKSVASTALDDSAQILDMRAKHERRNRRLRLLTSGLVRELLKEAPLGIKDSLQKQLKKDVAVFSLFAIICPDILERDSVASSDEEETAQVRSMMAIVPWRAFAHDMSFAMLQSFTVRLEHMQLPRYAALRTMLMSILQEYVKSAGECDDALSWQHTMADAVDALPQNVALKAKLFQCGYTAAMWTETPGDGHLPVKPLTTVTTSGTLSHEENLRQNLLRCYQEYGEILQQLHVTHVDVDGEQVKVVDLFDDRLSLEQLRGRRAVACRCIDQNLNKSVFENLAVRKLSLLTREEKIELECEEMVKKAEVSPKAFSVVLHTSLFHTAQTCSGGIIGCYAPNGEHCERPLEIGLRADNALASIYLDGMEIENVELVFGEEGTLVYKAYSNGHPYDTSEVWVEFFQVLLSSEHPAVPALIIQPGCPNTQTWLMLNRLVEPVTSGFHINCSYDFSPEWRTYLDSRPERVRGGVDIVLTPGFSNEVRRGDRALRRLASVQKDLAGLVFTDLMTRLVEDDYYRQFRFLGRSLAQSVGAEISCRGDSPEAILSAAFKYDVYQRKQTREGAEMIPEKDEIVSNLAQLVRSHTAEYCATIGVASLFAASRGNFFDLKHYLYHMRMTRSTLIDAKALRQQTDAIHRALNDYTLIVGIHKLSPADQEELMRWIFVNEDRVWRYRGGRDRNETLQQFFQFLPHRREGPASQPCYPGVIVLSLSSKRAADWSADMFQVEDVVAYAIGEFIKLQSGAQGYEIVTAFVQPRFRGLKLAVRMYTTAALESKCTYLTCDMLEGSMESVVRSNPALLALEHVGLLRYAVQKRELSYEVVDQTGRKEQFEKLIVNAWYLSMGMHAYGAFGWARVHPISSASLLMTPMLAAAGAYGGFQLMKRLR